VLYLSAVKAFIQADQNDEFFKVNAYLANRGFEYLGFETVKFQTVDEIQDFDRDCILVGGVGNVRERLKQLGIPMPPDMGYPHELEQYFGRRIWSSTLKEFIAKGKFGVFVKPKRTKLFTGKVVHEFKDLFGLNFDEEVEVWCADPLDFITEWRCFVYYKELIDVRRYKGRWDSRLNVEFVESAITDYVSSPAAYCLDIAIDENGVHYLVEVNEGFSLGTYGIESILYAKFLYARWAEITGSKDYLKV